MWVNLIETLYVSMKLSLNKKMEIELKIVPIYSFNDY